MKHIQKNQITMFLQPLSHFLQYVFKQFMSSFLCHLKFVGKVRLKMKEYMKNRKTLEHIQKKSTHYFPSTLVTCSSKCNMYLNNLWVPSVPSEVLYPSEIPKLNTFSQRGCSWTQSFSTIFTWESHMRHCQLLICDVCQNLWSINKIQGTYESAGTLQEFRGNPEAVFIRKSDMILFFANHCAPHLANKMIHIKLTNAGKMTNSIWCTKLN